MGYSPNYFAKKLVMNKSYQIGVFILGLNKLSTSEHFGFNFIEGIMEEAEKHFYDVILFSGNETKSFKKICKEKKIEGAIFIGLKFDNESISDIKNIDIPISIIDLKVNGKNISYISSDNKEGVLTGLEYLYSLGHRDIAIINGEKNSQISDIRYNAYLQFIKSHNIYNENYIAYGDFTRESGYKAMNQLLNKKIVPTAVFVTSDLMAIGAIQAIHDKKIRVPQDISVIGFDNIKARFEYIYPKLTTIGQDAIEIGRKSVENIILKINNKKNYEKILIKPQLIIRDSCMKI